ncbi:MAG: hypothetical protein JXO48_01155 [Deltaproteobacteria bacterium]|nr:hypothetical protein [Deltaproteobacteria bacterium]
MTHEDSGNYSGKHPEGTEVDPVVAEKLLAVAKEGGVGCAAAHAIAGECGREPGVVGRTIDLLELKIQRCQLGLFGYLPKHRIVEAAASVEPELENAIRVALQAGKLTCAASWDIARRFSLPKMAVSSACEKLGIKISTCQLGAFR